jgi:hypothetical protein
MSDTPETDDLARGNHVVPTEWAQQLERERDEAREKYDAEATEHMLAINKVCGERDEAIEKYRFAEIHRQIDVAKMERERDEAREELKQLKEKYGREG